MDDGGLIIPFKFHPINTTHKKNQTKPDKTTHYEQPDNA